MARRSRRTDRGSTIALALAGIALLGLIALVLNGIVSAASSSAGYVKLVNRSFATQANAVFSAQDPQGVALTKLLDEMPTMSRVGVEQELDSLVTATSSELDAAKAAVAPGPSGDLGQRFVQIVSARASAVSSIRDAVNGLLGMTPLPVAGAPGTTSVVPSEQLTEAQAATALTTAGQYLRQADGAVGPLRRAVARAPGHAVLRRSVFITNPSLLGPAAMADLVQSLQASSSLSVVHEISLLGVTLHPSALPTPGSTATNLPPTSTLEVTAIVRNLGNVGERPVRVTATTTPVSGGFADSVVAIGQVAAGGSVTLPLPSLKMKPGTTVTLVIAVTPVPGQQGSASLSQTLTVVVAPATSSL